jgi:hypothetical protein
MRKGLRSQFPKHVREAIAADPVLAAISRYCACWRQRELSCFSTTVPSFSVPVAMRRHANSCRCLASVQWWC